MIDKLTYQENKFSLVPRSKRNLCEIIAHDPKDEVKYDRKTFGRKRLIVTNNSTNVALKRLQTSLA